jgi:NitT/TauT family transport system substrate-binding protein
VLKQGFNVDPLLQKQADCISTMTYNEYWQVIDAGITADDLIVFKYEDQGVATLEDGLYVLEDEPRGSGLRRQDGPLREGLDEGLGLCPREPRRGGDIVLENDATGAQTEKHQKRMMGEIAKLPVFLRLGGGSPLTLPPQGGGERARPLADAP